MITSLQMCFNQKCLMRILLLTMQVSSKYFPNNHFLRSWSLPIQPQRQHYFDYFERSGYRDDLTFFRHLISYQKFVRSFTNHQLFVCLRI